MTKEITPLKAVRLNCLACCDNRNDVKYCAASKCPLHPLRMGKGSKGKKISVLKAIRKCCIECCDENRKAILWCPCDGIHATACPLWPYRLGKRPATVAKLHGPMFVTPKLMPDEHVPPDRLPKSLPVRQTRVQEALLKDFGPGMTQTTPRRDTTEKALLQASTKILEPLLK